MSVNERDFGEVYYEGGASKDDQPVTNRDHVSAGFHKMGEVLPYADRSSDITSGKFSDVGQSTYAAAADHTHNFLLTGLSSAPVDAAFEDARDGIMCVTTIAGARRLWVRVGGGWRFVAIS